MFNEKDFENMEKNLEEQLGNNVQEAEEEIRNAESTEVINEEITQESAADYSNNSVSEIVNDKVDEAVDNGATLIAEAEVTEVIVDDSKVKGVKYIKDGVEYDHNLNKDNNISLLLNQDDRN